MKQIVLNIKESKIPFFMELIKNFEFIKIANEEVDTKQEIAENLKKGLSDIKLIKKGKIKTSSLDSFLNEL
jgi:hypothetical protein